jgi:hypothetical protein
MPLSPTDATLLRVSKQLSGIPSMMLSDIREESEPIDLGPLDDCASNAIKISCAQNLDLRLRILQGLDGEQSFSTTAPEILLQSDINHTPGISLSSPDSSSSNGQTSPTTLLSSNVGNIPRRHFTALLRLLYLHASINPGNRSPHIPSLLAPLYAVLNQEIEAADLAHAEADTFWLFEAMVGEFSELEDEEGGGVWMKKFSERLSWADVDLSDNLV